MKNFFCAALLVMLCLPLCACFGIGEKNVGNKIPDVFGVNYTDAIEILESDGFEVTAIETNVDSISSKLLYPLEKVDKGSVFKIDEYILDNRGNLNKNYDAFYNGELISEDKSVVIYYAKEEYVLEKDAVPNTPTPSENSSPKASKPNTEEESKKDTSDDDSLNPDFKAAMDSYEKFMDEYVAFMKNYMENPTDLGLLVDYADFMSKYADFVEDFEKWEDEDLNTAELAYYIDVQARVTKKLLEITN